MTVWIIALVLMACLGSLIATVMAATTSARRRSPHSLASLNTNQQSYATQHNLREAPRIRIVIVDDHPGVVRVLKELLDSQADMEVVGIAHDGEEAIQVVKALNPDVVTMDIRMPNVDGFIATAKIKDANRQTKVLIHTAYGMAEYLYRAIRAGANGYILKGDHPQAVLDAVRQVNTGHWLITAQMASTLMNEFDVEIRWPQDLEGSSRSQLDSLQKECLRLLADGKNVEEIGRDLNISTNMALQTVQGIINMLYERASVEVFFRDEVTKPG
jgi:DNA-binding NarL/FixJ family response regulator